MRISSKLLKYAFPYSVCAALIAMILFFTRNQWSDFKAIEQVRCATVFWLSVCFVSSQVLAGLALKTLVAVFSVQLTFQEWFGLICVRSLGNYLPLSAGLTANAAYLKIEKDLPLSKFASLTAGNMVLSVLAGGLLGAILSIYRFIVTAHVQIVLLGIFVAVVALSMAIIIVPVGYIRMKGRVADWIRSVHIGWEMIRSRKRLLVSVVLLHFSILILIALQYGFLLNDMNYDLDWPAIMILTVATNIIRFASFFPGNLGLREAVAGGVTQAFGFSFSVGLLVSTIGRVVSMFWILLFGTLFIFLFLHPRQNRFRG